MHKEFFRKVSFFKYLLAFIIGVHFIFVIFDTYHKVEWVDIPMHLLGGIWAGLLFYHFFKGADNIKDAFGELKAIIMAVAFVMLIGVLWEFFEFSVSAIFHIKAQGSLQDTMGDLLMDMIGGAITGIALFTDNRR